MKFIQTVGGRSQRRDSYSTESQTTVKVVVDTNGLVAGLLSAFGPAGEIVRMIASSALSLCFDARILAEYGDVLLRPKFVFDGEQSGFSWIRSDLKAKW